MRAENKSNTPVYTISMAANILGISVHTLRMYEKECLIIPFQKESNQRLYSDNDIERINNFRKTIHDDKIGIAGLRSMASLMPCWEIVNCSEKDRKNCQSFHSYLKPCWAYKHESNVCADISCRECTVYLDFEYGKVKQKIFEMLQSKSETNSEQ